MIIYSQLLLILTTILSILHPCFAQKDYKNVVIIFIDDLGYGDTGPYGVADIPTPNIDKLAKEGVTFTQGYVPGPPCCPSRSSLMMGMYPQKFGKFGMSRGLPIPEDKMNMAQFFKYHGFVTGQIGKWDVGSALQRPLNIGFMEKEKSIPRKIYTEDEMKALASSKDEVKQLLHRALKKKKRRSKYITIKEDGSEGWLTEYDGDMAVEFITQHHQSPFFLYFSPEALHSINWEATESLRNRTTAKGKRQYLAGALVSVDDQVGKILNVLERYKLREDTLVMFSSDNGPNPNEEGSATPYRGGKFKGTQFEGWVHVPIIYSMPGTIPQGERYHGLSLTLDVFPTAAKLNDLNVPSHCDGVDFMPYLKGLKEGDPHEFIFWLNNDPNDSKHRHLTAARWKDYRLILNQRSDEWKLFNVKMDPREENDLALQSPEIVREMISAHEQWCKTHLSLKSKGAKPNKKQKATIIEPPEGYGMWRASMDHDVLKR